MDDDSPHLNGIGVSILRMYVFMKYGLTQIILLTRINNANLNSFTLDTHIMELVNIGHLVC